MLDLNPRSPAYEASALTTIVTHQQQSMSMVAACTEFANLEKNVEYLLYFQVKNE